MYHHSLELSSVWLQSCSFFHFSDNVYLKIKCNACVCQCIHVAYAAVWSVIIESQTCKLAVYSIVCCAQTQFQKLYTSIIFISVYHIYLLSITCVEIWYFLKTSSTHPHKMCE